MNNNAWFMPGTRAQVLGIECVRLPSNTEPLQLITSSFVPPSSHPNLLHSSIPSSRAEPSSYLAAGSYDWPQTGPRRRPASVAATPGDAPDRIAPNLKKKKSIFYDSFPFAITKAIVWRDIGSILDVAGLFYFSNQPKSVFAYFNCRDSASSNCLKFDR